MVMSCRGIHSTLVSNYISFLTVSYTGFLETPVPVEVKVIIGNHSSDDSCCGHSCNQGNGGDVSDRYFTCAEALQNLSQQYLLGVRVSISC